MMIQRPILTERTPNTLQPIQKPTLSGTNTTPERQKIDDDVGHLGSHWFG